MRGQGRLDGVLVPGEARKTKHLANADAPLGLVLHPMGVAIHGSGCVAVVLAQRLDDRAEKLGVSVQSQLLGNQLPALLGDAVEQLREHRDGGRTEREHLGVHTLLHPAENGIINRRVVLRQRHNEQQDAHRHLLPPAQTRRLARRARHILEQGRPLVLLPVLVHREGCPTAEHLGQEAVERFTCLLLLVVCQVANRAHFENDRAHELVEQGPVVHDPADNLLPFQQLGRSKHRPVRVRVGGHETRDDVLDSRLAKPWREGDQVLQASLGGLACVGPVVLVRHAHGRKAVLQAAFFAGVLVRSRVVKGHFVQLPVQEGLDVVHLVVAGHNPVAPVLDNVALAGGAQFDHVSERVGHLAHVPEPHRAPGELVAARGVRAKACE
mmetsp:Transcript_20154/g.57449  ORF Transcript_20154/g.57449 Transcript_20154/m.57449 type:complete len:382 (-) Transcript_20154:47-1192(-)